MRRRWISSCGVLLLACGGTPEGSVSIVTGDETDVFSRTPAPVVLVTSKIGTDGKRTEISRAPLPVDTVQLGEQARSELGALAVSGLDASGKRLVHGESLFAQWGVLEQSTLEVFVQRTGELARMPRGPAAFDASVATVVMGRLVLAANGTSTMVYDLLALKTLTTTTVLPRPAKSIASVGTAVLVIDEAGATTFDVSDGSSYALEPPSGGTFAEIAGGALVNAPDGTQYIVGATRSTGGPTARVLVIDPKGKATFASLADPREGACAAFVAGQGLVVAGGSSTANGAERLPPDAPLGTRLPFPADAVRGCAAAALDTSHVALTGGDAGGPMRVLDLACTTACAPTLWPDSIPLVRTETLPLAPDAAFVLGDDAAGATHAYRASATGLREIPLRIPRRGARLVAMPTGAFAVVGGGVGIEHYWD